MGGQGFPERGAMLHALKQTSTCPPTHQRTNQQTNRLPHAGVLTKVDIMDRGTDCRDVLMGRTLRLRHGWVAVVNRGQADINSKVRGGALLRGWEAGGVVEELGTQVEGWSWGVTHGSEAMWVLMRWSRKRTHHVVMRTHISSSQHRCP